ncbi:hypothetical protein HWV62_13187 [Athelia sp. TMB]|nr:hypothetical protein HWV62_13187 [Athelia sp. TMB]
MAHVDVTETLSIVCYHCNQSTSLTRPDVNIRASSIPDVLGSNGLLPDQAVAVQGTLAATLLDISSLDRDVLRLEAALKELKRKRAALLSFADSHRTFLNPVSRLPVEVLSHIFQQCITVCWLSAAKAYPETSLDRTPLMIASVNRQWRQVALNTPRLWASFSMEIRPKDTKRLKNLAILWLSRSGDSLLYIRLSSLAWFRDPMQKLIQIFAAQSKRWRNVYFKLPLPALRCLSMSKMFDLTNLELLQFDFCETGGFVSLPEPVDIFLHSKIRHFSAGLDVNRYTLSLPWQQLRTIQSLPSDHCSRSMLKLLKLASNVEECNMRATYGHGLPPDPSQAPGSVHLPNLRSLTAVFDSEDPEPFFTILDIPNIRELSLATNTDWRSLRFILISICSQCPLERLALLSMPNHRQHREPRALSGTHMRKVLKAAQDLRELELPEDRPKCFSATFMERFGQLTPSGTPILCPNLRKLLLRYSEEMDFELLAAALLSRCSLTFQPTLKTITVLCRDTERASIMEAWRNSSWWIQLRDVGIDMRASHLESYEQWW